MKNGISVATASHGMSKSAARPVAMMVTDAAATIAAIMIAPARPAPRILPASRCSGRIVASMISTTRDDFSSMTEPATEPPNIMMAVIITMTPTPTTMSAAKSMSCVLCDVTEPCPAAAATAAATAMPVAGELSINTDSHQVFRGGKAIDLTQREYELLTFLASHPNKVYSRVALMEQVWNYGYVGDDVRTVDVTVRRLREKIEADPANPTYILTRRGAGYYFSV